MSNITEVAERVEDILHGQVLWSLPMARLYAVTNGADGLRVDFTDENADIYALLEDSNTHLTAMTADYIALVTTGWAAPVAEDDDGDTPPSRHPERRRVRLMVIANGDEMGSVLRFEDDPTEAVVDSGSASGALADAVRLVMKSARKK